ncbi:MAG: hypothetical protein Tp136SUR676911_38 [Prokaryotic dsDNA virus sp.]|jgi:hypothetical protein|nr:MAG: hypothetical protein Tp136SUR676911_38 [Prokaryotic dsDNA virus sp.]|tara:strand:+ start:26773 stop:27036 length:264 start_codon:yes stop_codon:yes gene_type:complete
MTETIPKELDEILDLVTDFLEDKGNKSYFISSFKKRGEYRVEVKLMMSSKEACDLWVEFIDVLIDKEMDTDYPMVHFGRSEHYDEEA